MNPFIADPETCPICDRTRQLFPSEYTNEWLCGDCIDEYEEDHKESNQTKMKQPTETIQMVEQFMRAFGQEIPDKPALDNRQLKTMRASLINEELFEYICAWSADDRVGMLDALLDLQYVVDGAVLALGLKHIPADTSMWYEGKTQTRCIENLSLLLVWFMFAASDHANAYVAATHLACMGKEIKALARLTKLDAHWDEAFAEVHRSNMSKLGPDGKPIYRADGKVMKGPGYTKPNLEPFVK